MKISRMLGTLSLSILAPVLALAQQDFSQVEVKAQPVAGNVWMITGSGGNIGVSTGPDGVLIVDDQFAPLAEKIRAAIRGINPGPLKFILNTHWHGDHTGGNEVFGKEGTIIAHANVRKRISTQQTLMDRTVPPSPPGAWPVITFEESVSAYFNGEEIRVLHYPKGHTDGDAVIHFTGSNVVHMGDLFFAGRFPFVDLASGGDVKGYTRDVEEVIRRLRPGVKIIPGHGPLSTMDDLKRFHWMLVETTRLVREQIKAGKDLKTIQSEGLPEEWKGWAWEFISAEKWIETVYNSLARKP